MDPTWKNGARAKTDPVIAKKEILRIRAKHGKDGYFDAIVTESKPKAAKLHTEFEWNDKIAAHIQRVERARYLVRHLVEVRDDAPDLGPVRVFECATVETGKGTAKVFWTLDEILNDAEQRARLLQRALNEFSSFKRRYGQLSELAKVFAALDEIAA